jgi:hypothetical protein
MTKKKSPEQVAMEDALEVVLERADWVGDRINTYLEEEYDIEQVVDDWCEESLEEHVNSWLDAKYDDEGPDDSTFKKVVQDACRHAVKEFMTEAIMLELLDEVRANMGKLLGRAMKDYMNEVNQVKE